MRPYDRVAVERTALLAILRGLAWRVASYTADTPVTAFRKEGHTAVFRVRDCSSVRAGSGEAGGKQGGNAHSARALFFEYFEGDSSWREVPCNLRYIGGGFISFLPGHGPGPWQDIAAHSQPKEHPNASALRCLKSERAIGGIQEPPTSSVGMQEVVQARVAAGVSCCVEGWI
jgi:hypothetical protein